MMAEPRGSLGNYVDRLLAAVDRGEVELRFNLIALNTPGRRTYSGFDNNVWFGGTVAVSVSAFVIFSWMTALIASAIAFVVFLSVGRKSIFARAQDRALRLLRMDESVMLDFWRDRVVMLHHRPTGTDCVPPDGDWREFVRDHLLIGR